MHIEQYAETAYGAVAERDSTSELDEIASTDGVVLLHKRNEVVDRVVDTVVGREIWLNRREEEHRAVGASAAGKCCVLVGVPHSCRIETYALGP